MKKLQYKDLKLTSEQEAYLKTVASAKWRANRDENITQIWFETFLEHLGQVGYKIVYSDDEI